MNTLFPPYRRNISPLSSKIIFCISGDVLMLEIYESQVAIKPLKKDIQMEMRGNQFTSVRNQSSEYEPRVSARN